MVTKRSPDLDPQFSTVPFVPLHPGIVDLDDLMVFDRDTCEVFRQFRRNIHPADVPTEIARLGNVVTTGQVLVTYIRPGVRTRMCIG
jgi:hypothetical protein